MPANFKAILSVVRKFYAPTLQREKNSGQHERCAMHVQIGDRVYYAFLYSSISLLREIKGNKELTCSCNTTCLMKKKDLNGVSVFLHQTKPNILDPIN